MKKTIVIVLGLIIVSCNNYQGPKPSTVKSDTAKLITQFSSPEELIECYYKAMKAGNMDQIGVCLGGTSTSELSYIKLPGISYRIISKEKFQDSIYAYKINDKGQYEEYWDFPEVYLVTQDSSDFEPGHYRSYYWIGKKDSSWIIMGNSSEIETVMEETESEGIERAPRTMDSIQNADHKLN
jgi:hypothetical protein